MSDSTPLIGEPLALDLVNTAPDGPDLLGTAEQLAKWLARQADRLHGVGIEQPTATDLNAVRAVRDDTAAALEAILAGQQPPTTALRGLEKAQAAAPLIRELTWNGDAVVATARRDGPLGAAAAAALAESAIDLLTDPSIDKLKRCEADDCVLLFLPTHPRRRWCSAQRCGNRVRVARYYQRHKPEGSAN
ncbi:CGNR zinc finger domain-containing protein [Nocardia sp. NBC_01009]|uniref:CGNR zinc finger domain-containing protein n=1 Tax=Nocardia sp. NBC_01009 TaxID=2975996 RepID=UPI003867DEB0|nr:CGNR zinc finger domain-containing protein [Nocardia sp. NBC_01009]